MMSLCRVFIAEFVVSQGVEKVNVFPFPDGIPVVFVRRVFLCISFTI